MPKAAGSYADALEAVGLADLVASLASDSAAKVSIADDGARYRVTISPPLDEEEVRSTPVGPGYDYFLVKAPDRNAPAAGRVFDYPGQRAIEQTYIRAMALQKKSGKKKRITPPPEGSADAPSPTLALFKAFNSMRMTSNAYNDLHRALRDTPGLASIALARLREYGAPEGRAARSPASGSEKALEKAAANLQFFNPATGKGTNRPKPDSTSVNSLPGQLVDWFAEWMKFRAMSRAMLACPADKDYKIMVLAPAQIDYQALCVLHDGLLGQRMWGNLQLEIRAILTLAGLIIRNSKEFAGEGGTVIIARRTPRDIVRGLHVAHFKSLGNARAVMNVSFLGVPGWFAIADRGDAEAWLSSLQEHESWTRTMREDHSDDVPLLQLCRDFISNGGLEHALAFYSAWSADLMGRLNRDGPPPWLFSESMLRRVFMTYSDQEKPLAEILESEGFQRLTWAVRNATVTAQTHKADRKPWPFTARYGMAQEWKRKARYRDDFVLALADFVQGYNADIVRDLERHRTDSVLAKGLSGKPTAEGAFIHKAISEQHLADVIRLIDTRGSRLVAQLLLAFGYSRPAPRETKGDRSGESEE